jgi:alkylated DNA nucleotide flippase Atl1
VLHDGLDPPVGILTPDEYVEEVLSVVERIPPGRVMSYGAIADYLEERSGRWSARLVGNIMARYGDAVPWHRVVTSSGRVVPSHAAEARARLLAEGTPMRNSSVDMPRAAWHPDEPAHPWRGSSRQFTLRGEDRDQGQRLR